MTACEKWSIECQVRPMVVHHPIGTGEECPLNTSVDTCSRPQKCRISHTKNKAQFASYWRALICSVHLLTGNTVWCQDIITITCLSRNLTGISVGISRQTQLWILLHKETASLNPMNRSCSFQGGIAALWLWVCSHLTCYSWHILMRSYVWGDREWRILWSPVGTDRPASEAVMFKRLPEPSSPG